MQLQINILIHGKQPNIVCHTELFSYKENCVDKIGLNFKKQEVIGVDANKDSLAQLDDLIYKEVCKEFNKLINGDTNNAISKCPFVEKTVSYKLKEDGTLARI